MGNERPEVISSGEEFKFNNVNTFFLNVLGYQGYFQVDEDIWDTQ